MNPLQTSIINTLAYFDIFSYPLTITELYRYLWKPPKTVSLDELQTTVQEMATVEIHNGLLCLRDRSEIILKRAIAYEESERKYKKRLPFIKLLTYLPYVEAIFVVNSLAFQNVHTDSDIDLLIISKPGKIWSTRFFTTIVAKLLRVRPRPNFTKDTLCLSFYIDGNSLNLQTLMSDPQDIHEVYWLNALFPVYDPYNFAQKIQTANSWMKDYLPNSTAIFPHPLRTISHSWLNTCSQAIIGLLSIERFWKAIQLTILPGELKRLSGPIENSVVVLSDSLLKFHTHNPKPLWRKRWKETVELYTKPIPDRGHEVQYLQL